MIDTSKTTRVEVIDWTGDADDGCGRVFVHWDENTTEVEVQQQDDGRTLKIFIVKKDQIKSI